MAGAAGLRQPVVADREPVPVQREVRTRVGATVRLLPGPPGPAAGGGRGPRGRGVPRLARAVPAAPPAAPRPGPARRL